MEATCRRPARTQPALIDRAGRVPRSRALNRRATTAALGIDVGGTGVKAALVNLVDGTLLSRRVRRATPEPSLPKAVAATIAEVLAEVASEVKLPTGLPVGCGVPGVVKDGRLMTAANIDKGWLEVAAAELIGNALGRRVHLLNDADAAGIAEMAFGAGRDHHGTVLMLTIGTGIGSGLFLDGRLVPNTELGHLELNGRDAETRVSGAARDRRGIKWRVWAEEFNAYLARLEAYLWPDLIILGGGVSKAYARYGHLLESRAPIEVAQFLNSAGIAGAALYAARVEAALD